MFPESYRLFLLETNGGTPLKPFVNLYPIDPQYGINEDPNELEVSKFLSLTEVKEALHNLQKYTYAQDTPLPFATRVAIEKENYYQKNLIPIAECYNDLIFIDTGELSYGSVVFNNYDFGYLLLAKLLAEFFEICYEDSLE